MIFTTASLVIAGLAATLIPIVVHLLSKGKPRKIVFPALRFTKSNLQSTRRRYAVKRFALLATRVLLVALLGAALARPFLPNGLGGASGSDGADPNAEGLTKGDAPIAAAIVLDSSLRMARVKNNERLFETARATARAIMDHLPRDSEIAILSGVPDGDAFQADRFSARERLDKLTTEPRGRDVAETTTVGLELLSRSRLRTREIFVVTDGAKRGWSERDMKRVRRAYEAATRGDAETTLYLVDLGDSAYRNGSIVDVALSSETTSANGAVQIDAEVERVGDMDGDLEIETLLFDARDFPSGASAEELAKAADRAKRRDVQTLSYSAGRSRRVATFSSGTLSPGFYIGLTRILGRDALDADDARVFVFDVEQDWRLLVLAREPRAESSLFLTQALAPEELRKTNRAPFELDVETYGRANGDGESSIDASLIDLDRYRAIFLLDPPGLDDATLDRLTDYVESGGGLAFALGRGASPIKSFQKESATRLLGVKPTRVESAAPDAAFAPRLDDAPLLAPFRPFARDEVPWDALEVERFWKLEEPSETAAIVADFRPTAEIGIESDREYPPALVENELGQGLVATLATPISDAALARPWNALATGDAPWVFVLLMDGVARRLASGTSAVFNYAPGETVVLRSPLKKFPAVATTISPDGEELSIPTDVERRQIRVPGPRPLGAHAVKTRANADGDEIDARFAVAAPGADFDMSRYTDEEWRTLWNGIPYKELDLALAGSDLEKARRWGSGDLYPALVVLLAALFLLETRLSNRFYASRRREEARA